MNNLRNNLISSDVVPNKKGYESDDDDDDDDIRHLSTILIKMARYVKTFDGAKLMSLTLLSMMC